MSERGRRAPAEPVAEPVEPQAPPRPDLRDPRFTLERETLKLVLQHPGVVGNAARDVDEGDFTHPTYRAVWEAVAASGGPPAGAGDPGWATRLRDGLRDPEASSALSALSVEPIRTAKEPDLAYVHAHVFRLQELTVLRRIADLKSRLQRTNPVEHAADYNRMFGELVALEQHRRDLREKAMGSA